jgi:hypothetical protein
MHTYIYAYVQTKSAVKEAEVDSDAEVRSNEEVAYV